MSVPSINFHRLVRTAADVTTIARGVSRRLAARPASPVAPISRQPPPLPGNATNPTLLNFSAARGEVIGLRVITKAFTQSGGGGGYIYQGTGTIAPVWTQTTHVRRTEFWLRDWNTHQENNFWLEGHDGVVLRDGQDVTLVWCNGELIWLRNHTANQVYPLVHHERLLPSVSDGAGSFGRTVDTLGMAGGAFWLCCLVLSGVVKVVGLPSSGLVLALIALLSLPVGLTTGIALHRRLARRDQHIARASAAYRARAEAEMRAAYQRYLT